MCCMKWQISLTREMIDRGKDDDFMCKFFQRHGAALRAFHESLDHLDSRQRVDILRQVTQKLVRRETNN